MRDPGVIDALDAPERYARAFDAISDEQDARYSARSFVRWVRLETTPVARDTQAVTMVGDHRARETVG